MSLFGGSRPKGITKEELRYVQGELKNTSFGHGSEALNDRQVSEIIHRLELCLDPDSQQEREHHWEQADQSEVNTIEGQLSHDTNLHLTSAQQAHVKTVLQKYVDIDKHGGMFSI